MLARAPMPAVRQKRSKLAPTSCQASSTIATGTTVADVLDSFMALLSFVDSAPRAYWLKVSNARPPISTSTGTSPEKTDAGVGFLQVSDARGRLLVFDRDAEPHMRRRAQGLVPFVDEFLQERAAFG